MMITEKVWCKPCSGTGEVPKLVFWHQPCPVCDGEGKRRIIMDASFPEDIKQHLRESAITGLNQPLGGLTNSVFGFRLF